MPVLNFSDFTQDEKIAFYLLLFSFLTAIVSGVFVYSNESDEIKKKPLLREVLGGVDVFFTGRYLNGQGKRWRIPYVISVVFIILASIYLWK